MAKSTIPFSSSDLSISHMLDTELGVAQLKFRWVWDFLRLCSQMG